MTENHEIEKPDQGPELSPIACSGSETPRTDDMCGDVDELGDWIDKRHGSLVSADFARDLERENTRLREALDTLTSVIGLTPVLGNKEALQEAFDIARNALSQNGEDYHGVEREARNGVDSSDWMGLFL